MFFSRRGLIAGAAALAFARTNAAVAAETEGARGAVDLMPDFWRAIDASDGLTRTERAQRLTADFVEPHRDVFALAGLKKLDAPRIERWFGRIESSLADIRRLDGEVGEVWGRNARLYGERFPDFDPAASPVYFMPSFLAFDAHLEPNDGVLPLFVGLDGVVFYHGPGADLAVLLSHELFHCYHAQRAPQIGLDPTPALYEGLWMEGLATYASEQLNPAASRLAILLDDKPLNEASQAVVRKMAATMLARLDSRDEADFQAFFSAGFEGAWPARGGYLVGLLAARDIGATMSLRDMAGLSPPAVRALLEPRLRALAA